MTAAASRQSNDFGVNTDNPLICPRLKKKNSELTPCEPKLDRNSPIYCSQQINIPPRLPDILKNFTKAAIRTKPEDLLSWAAAYFRCMADGVPLPILGSGYLYDCLDKTSTGLSEGLLKSLHNQLSWHRIVLPEVIKDTFLKNGLKKELYDEIIYIGHMSRETEVEWLKFLVATAAYLVKNGTETLRLCCNILTTDQPGGASRIKEELFRRLLHHLADIDRDITEDDIAALMEHLRWDIDRQGGYVSPANFLHKLCPPICSKSELTFTPLRIPSHLIDAYLRDYYEQRGGSTMVVFSDYGRDSEENITPVRVPSALYGKFLSEYYNQRGESSLAVISDRDRFDHLPNQPKREASIESREIVVPSDFMTGPEIDTRLEKKYGARNRLMPTGHQLLSETNRKRAEDDFCVKNDNAQFSKINNSTPPRNKSEKNISFNDEVYYDVIPNSDGGEETVSNFVHADDTVIADDNVIQSNVVESLHDPSEDDKNGKNDENTSQGGNNET